MSSPRLRRLKADHETLLARFRNLRQVEVESSHGNPPEKYVIRFKTKGLEMLEDGRIVERTEHRAEINIPFSPFVDCTTCLRGLPLCCSSLFDWRKSRSVAPPGDEDGTK